MYLVMTKEKPTLGDIEKVVSEFKVPVVSNSYDGESTRTLEANLLKEDPSSVVITADSRFLMFANHIFTIDDVYIYENGKLVTLRETTLRILRPAHNLMKMYEAGSFSLE